MRLARSVLLTLVAGVTLSFATGMTGCQPGPVTAGDYIDLAAPSAYKGMYYWGHSTFSITSSQGKVLVFDPYNAAATGYPDYRFEPDVVLISHDVDPYLDTSWMLGEPQIVRGLDEAGQVRAIDEGAGPFHVQTVPATYTPRAEGESGNTAIFIVEIDGVRIVHLGLLGQAQLTDAQLDAIGRPDFLLIPVGGYRTIDAATACVMIDEINPRYVIPMVYQTPANPEELAGNLAPVDDFYACFPRNPLDMRGNGLTFSFSEWPEQPQALLVGYLPKY